MIGRAQILKAAATIKAKGGVSDDEALRRAEQWAAKKNAEAAAVTKPLSAVCILPDEAKAKGIRSPRCDCENCGGFIDARRQTMSRNYDRYRSGS